MINLRSKEPRKEIPPKRKDFLKKAIHDCHQAFNDAWLGLQNANEPDVIDRYIYELNAADMRYRVLIREMRQIADAEEKTQASPAVRREKAYPVPALLSAAAAGTVSANISSTNLDTETSLLNRSFR